MQAAVSFFTEFKGQVLRVKDRPVELNKITGIGTREVKIAQTPDVLMVIPRNHEYDPKNPFIRVNKSPFGSGAVGLVAKAILEDLGVEPPPLRRR